ncbi:MAG TPA: MBL fold metallo-hydrolase [Clostridiales bacterium]|nr:MBL fold metallo-hydrolase [Clostridiales bacterium]
MNENQYYSVTGLGNGITQIRDIFGVQAYLVEGKERAALIDTLVGFGNLKEVVESLTSLPVVVLNTHGHVDHAGGNYAFDHVYLSKEDYDLAQRTTTVQFRMKFADYAAKQMGLPRTWDDHDFTAPRDIKYYFLEDGQRIELGARTLEAIAVPGHTKGSVAFLDHCTNGLFIGDACNPSTFLFDQDATPVSLYRDSLLRLKKRYPEGIERMYLCHVMAECSYGCVDDVIEACELVLSGKDSKQPFVFGFDEESSKGAIWGCPVDEKGMRKDGKFGNIIFNKDRSFFSASPSPIIP